MGTAMMKDSDDTIPLLRQAAAGDQNALGELWNRYRERLKRMVRLRLDRRLQGRIDPSDVPVTLVVELGRVNLTLRRLADLKPGDVIELGRHSREPVELPSGGRLVARGELVQIDTELGVRITQVFL